MVIPAAQQKSASELISIYVKIYEALQKHVGFESLFKLFNEHLETALNHSLTVLEWA